MYLVPEELIKVAFALLLGGLIGIEREFRDKAAGFRTLIFICVGATLFTIFSVKMAGDKEPTRIAANIVVGIGFLGAGVIMRETGGRVVGMTTAASIWLIAALGMGIGAGEYLLSTMIAGIALLVLWLFPRLEQLVDRSHSERAYEVVSGLGTEKFEALKSIFQSCGLHVRLYRQAKSDGQMITYWHTSGPAASHDRLMQKLLAAPDVIEFRV